MISAYIGNLGKYNEGILAVEPLRFPASTEEVQAVLSKIGVDGIRYEEVFIADYETNVAGLRNHLGEGESIDELNYLASLLDGLDNGQKAKYEAALSLGEYTGSVKDLINLTQNLDCFEFYPGVKDEEELGRMYILEFEALTVPEHLIDYIDYEAYGRDVRINEGGHFAPGGYVFDNQSKFIEHYTGLDDIPEEYRISNVHARDEKEETRSILETIKQFKEAPPVPHKDKAGPSHEGR